MNKQLDDNARMQKKFSEGSMRIFNKRWILICSMILCANGFQILIAQQPDSSSSDEINALKQKEKMIRDRFQRFEDRIFRLRDQLLELEPENAEKLTRALQRSGELGLMDKLSAIIEQLHSPSTLQNAADAQSDWVNQVDQLLAILLARDSENEERKDDIQRLLEYKEKLSEILSEQIELRDQAAQKSLAKRMSQQLDQAIRRVDELLKRQKKLTPDQNDAKQQQQLSRDTRQLAEDVKRLSKPQTDASKDSPSLEGARSKAESASESLQSGSQSMSKASELSKQSQSSQAKQQQKSAEKALEEAREKLQQAKDKLQEKSSSEKMAEEQDQLAEKTGELAEKMDKEASEDSPSEQENQSGDSQNSSSPGTKNLKQAQGNMKGASEGLKQQREQDAMEDQDKAIEQLEQAQKALEEELNKLRKEERGEMLRDLEVRFREMLSKQRAINEATVILDEFGKENFKRDQRLQLADLATQENVLSQKAATCLHILEEDATTVIFPRVVEQVSEDMNIVASRLTHLKVGSLTQSIENEIVETLEQLLGAIQQMQQENEQGDQQGSNPQSNEDQPLLPNSAELKLLRASQFRVNTRTEAIADAIEEGTESPDTGKDALLTVAKRQVECSSMATEMRDRQKLPQ